MSLSVRPEAGAPREYHFPDFSRHKLSNGANVILAPTTKLPVVTVLAVIDAGARADTKRHEGLAQLTAEALREGTPGKSGVEILEGFERIGTSFESGADWDSTVASMTLLKEHLREGLALMADVLTSPSFPEREVERLKAERLAERLQILAEPRGLADEWFAKTIYRNESRFSEPIGGNSASIKSLDRATLDEFFRSRYTPATVTIIVVGDVTMNDALEFLESSFRKWEGGGTQYTGSPVTEARSSVAVDIISKLDAAQAEVRLGHLGIPRNHPEYFNIVVMNALLGGLFSSRINLNLREKHGYTYGASSYFDWRRDVGPFVIATAVQSEVAAAAVRETLNEIDGMRSNQVSADELSLATDYLEGVFPIRYETTAAIASALANLVIFDLPEDFYNTYRSNIHAVTSADVLAAAQKYVHPEKLQCVVVGDPRIIQEPLEKLNIGPVSVRAAIEP